MLAEQKARTREDRRQVLSAVDSMNEANEPTLELGPPGGSDGRRRRRPEDFEGALDALPCGHGVSEGQRRADQPDDFLVERVLVAMDVVDWITGSTRGDIAAGQ